MFISSKQNSCELFCPDKNETNRFRQDDADFFKMLIRSVRVQRLGVMKDIFSKTSRTLDSEQFIRGQLEAYLKVRNFKVCRDDDGLIARNTILKDGNGSFSAIAIGV